MRHRASPFGQDCSLLNNSLSRSALTAFVGYIFQVLARRLRFQLERAPCEGSLIDRTGRTLKMEPLASVGDLERYLLKMVKRCIIFPVVRRFISVHKEFTLQTSSCTLYENEE